jgi:predicted protein tyrosine phosphatase
VASGKRWLLLSNSFFQKISERVLSLIKKLLFICSRNRLRNPTAEAVFAAYEGLEVESAGLAPDAETSLNSEVIRWADIIFVMERSHRSKLSKRFQPWLKDKRVICLDIPDQYEYMNPDLVALLEKKVLPLLGSFYERVFTSVCSLLMGLENQI